MTYDSRGKRDPFVPLLTSGKAEIQGLEGVESIEDIVVEGIIYDAVNGSLVIANGLVFKEGEGTESVIVKKIKADGVEFIINEKSEFKPFEATDSI